MIKVDTPEKYTGHNMNRHQRWGASVTGVCQCALRACSMRCRVLTSCTDRRSSEHWLERSQYPDPDSACINKPPPPPHPSATSRYHALMC